MDLFQRSGDEVRFFSFQLNKFKIKGWYLLKILILFLGAYSQYIFASISDLIDFASPEGTMKNETSPSIIKNQAGGFVSGGSMILRGPRPKMLQPIQIQTPKFKLDPCTGSADFMFGSLSYISGEEFMKFLQGLPKQIGAYGLKMALKTVCPQCEDIVMDLEEISRSINNMTLEQCALSQSIAKGMFGALANEEQQRCLTRSAAAKGAKDMHGATKSCKDDKNAFPEGKPEAEKNLLGDRFNLVWKALKEGGGGSSIDQEFFELIMSVSGTLVAEKQDDSYVFRTYPSLFDQTNIENLIGGAGGSQLKLYSCSGGAECLKMNVTAKRIAPKDTLMGKIMQIIDKYLVEHIRNDAPISKMTQEEMVLISYVSVPLLRLIENEIASKGQQADFITSSGEMIEIIAYDLMINFLSNMAKMAEDKVVALKVRENETQKIDSFLSSLKSTQNRLMNFKHTAYQRAVTIMQVKERVRQQDNVFEAQFLNLWRAE